MGLPWALERQSHVNKQLPHQVIQMCSNSKLWSSVGGHSEEGGNDQFCPGRVREVSKEATFKLSLKGGVRIFQTKGWEVRAGDGNNMGKGLGGVTEYMFRKEPAVPRLGACLPGAESTPGAVKKSAGAKEV